MRFGFLLILSILVGQVVLAQENIPEVIDGENNTPAILKELNINQDPRLEEMLNWHIEKNKKRNGIQGFRVEIFFSSAADAKNEAFRKKVEFLSKYPDYPVHVKFIAPNFRVRIGDFRTKNEALKLYKKIQVDYPSAFIIKDEIDFPLLKRKNYE